MERYDELEDQTSAMEPAQARAYLTRLAVAGDAAAQCLLADGLDEGAFDIRDSELSVSWYRQSAVQGYTRAEFYLGSMTAYGIGTAPDVKEAAIWFRRAAAKGDSASQYRLGELLATQQIIPAPGEDGQALLELAARQGHDDAVQLLKRLRDGA